MINSNQKYTIKMFSCLHSVCACQSNCTRFFVNVFLTYAVHVPLKFSTQLYTLKAGTEKKIFATRVHLQDYIKTVIIVT